MLDAIEAFGRANGATGDFDIVLPVSALLENDWHYGQVLELPTGQKVTLKKPAWRRNSKRAINIGVL